MKKISALIAVLMGLALIVGCSNDSDGGSGYFGPALPASSGNFAPLGKTFKFVNTRGDVRETVQFGVGVLTRTEEEDTAATARNHAYTQKTVKTYSYSYNETTKSVYMVELSELQYIVREGVQTPLPTKSVIVSDAQFVNYVKDYIKLTADLVTDEEQINQFIYEMRKMAFTRYGYKSDDGSAEIDALVLARFNEGMAAERNLITSLRYELTGSTLKVSHDGAVPKDLKFSQLFNSYALYDSTTSATLNLKGQDPYESPNLVSGATGYLISSVDASYIYTSKKGTATVYGTTDPIIVWTYVASDKKFEYKDTANTTSNDSLSVKIADFPEFEIKYATASNADFTYAQTYTLQLQ